MSENEGYIQNPFAQDLYPSRESLESITNFWFGLVPVYSPELSNESEMSVYTWRKPTSRRGNLTIRD